MRFVGTTNKRVSEQRTSARRGGGGNGGQIDATGRPAGTGALGSGQLMVSSGHCWVPSPHSMRPTDHCWCVVKRQQGFVHSFVKFRLDAASFTQILSLFFSSSSSPLRFVSSHTPVAILQYCYCDRLCSPSIALLVLVLFIVQAR